MPHRSRHFHRHGTDHGGRYAEPDHRGTSAIKPADYTLGHAGRQVRVGPVLFWTVVGTLVIMAVWSVATATYFAFRDDLLTRLIARQADMQYAYEDRVAELRSQVDRLTSRQLLDQEQFEQKLEQLMRRRRRSSPAPPRSPARPIRCRPARSSRRDAPRPSSPRPSRRRSATR